MVIELRARERCGFRLDSARSLHAALLRRIEHVDPELSRALHDAPRAAHGVIRPWTIANLVGPFERHAGQAVATPDGVYSTRVTVLTTPVFLALRQVLIESQPVTLDLEHVSFDAQVRQECATTYGDRACAASANRYIELMWCSPTALRSGASYTVELAPALCLASYLRRWNAFAPADLRIAEEPVLQFAASHITVDNTKLRTAKARPGMFGITGSTGRATWLCQSEPRVLVRQVNLLVDYAFYCGTGVKTALGMGQTTRGA